MEYKYTEGVQQEALDTLKEWISYPSILDEDSKDTPFGEDIQRALEAALKTCESMGMSTYIDPEGYYGYSEIGEGEELLAILCHLDVVPAGNEADWQSNPFELSIRDNKLYGRGTQDDKGPSVAALYALKALMDEGVTFNKRVRFIFGTDEENLWRCLAKYGEKEEKATYGFAPDSSFPLTYAEKGLLQCYITGPGSEDLALYNNGAFNVVPEVAEYTDTKADELAESLSKRNYEFKHEDDTIKTIGKAIHAKDADRGVNALTHLAVGLNDHYDHPTLKFITKYFADGALATDIFGKVEDEMSGKLTCNFAKLIVNESSSKMGFDLRIPVTADKDQIVRQLSEACEEFGLVYEEFDYLASLYVPLDHELIQTLLGVYRELTGDMSEPISSGGATFARTMENCVAFGARTPEVPNTEHGVDENMPLDNFYEAMEIYAHAIKKLATNN